jgi:hypothetical protein
MNDKRGERKSLGKKKEEMLGLATFQILKKN